MGQDYEAGDALDDPLAVLVFAVQVVTAGLAGNARLSIWSHNW